ncbi:MAG: hypothetical protein KGI41_00850 [Patescibacteria group bacterium]|nr:hypothetical protein [Patescibacteria group bacterium]
MHNRYGTVRDDMQWLYRGRIAGWALALMVLCFAPVFWAVWHTPITHIGPRPQAQAPATKAEISALLAKVEKEFKAPAGPAAGYFRIADDVLTLRQLASGYVLAHGRNAMVDGHMLEAMDIETGAPLITLQKRYVDASSTAEWIRARDAYSALVKARDGYDVGDFTDSLRWLFISYLASTFVALFLYFPAALAYAGRCVWLEGELVIIAAFLWPIAIFGYPSEFVVDQTRRAKRRIGMFVSFVLSLVPMTAVAKTASGSHGYEDAGSDAANAIVLDEIPLPKLSFAADVFSAKLNSNGTVLHDGATATWSVRAAFQGGVSFTWGGTRQFSGYKTDENDYDVAVSGTRIGLGRAWTFGTSIYDIRPLGSSRGGDFIAPHVGFETGIGHGFRLFVRGEYDAHTADARKSGHVLQAGLAHPWALGSGITLDTAVSALEAGGPFHQAEGWSLRGDVLLSVPIAKHLSGVIAAKMFAPIVRARDRRPDAALSIGLRYAFN